MALTLPSAVRRRHSPSGTQENSLTPSSSITRLELTASRPSLEQQETAEGMGRGGEGRGGEGTGEGEGRGGSLPARHKGCIKLEYKNRSLCTVWQPGVVRNARRYCSDAW